MSPDAAENIWCTPAVPGCEEGGGGGDHTPAVPGCEVGIQTEPEDNICIFSIWCSPVCC